MIKFSPEKIMPTKVFHIYAKDECLYPNLTEEQFSETWETLKGMVGLLHTDYNLEDLSYEEVEKPALETEEASY
tara:strand:- start:1424 stop:1645 length:222 start_codon:yes stop_codon:yes gene_type:complete